MWIVIQKYLITLPHSTKLMNNNDSSISNNQQGLHNSNFISSSQLETTLSEMSIDHAIGKDICIIGERGSGKTTLVREWLNRMQFTAHETITIPMYKDY